MPHTTLEYPRLPFNTVNRYSARAYYELSTIHSIISAASILHVSFNAASSPFPTVLPMIGALGSFDRPSAGMDEVLDLYLHAHANHRLASLASSAAADGHPVTIAASHADGLVLSLSPFSHSVNYRSASLFGHATLVTDPEEKLYALKTITNGIVPGRWANTRTPPTKAELTTTSVLRVRIQGGSAKIRKGGAHEERQDLESDEVRSKIWAGVVPVYGIYGDPVAAEHCEVKTLPAYLDEFVKEKNESMKGASIEGMREP